jgi:hypothetical protein
MPARLLIIDNIIMPGVRTYRDRVNSSTEEERRKSVTPKIGLYFIEIVSQVC